MTVTNILLMIISDLLKVLQSPQKTSSVFNSQRELSSAIKTIQTILFRGNIAQQVASSIEKINPIVETVEPDPVTTNTNTRFSQSEPTHLFPIGTIIRKILDDGIFYEGAI